MNPHTGKPAAANDPATWGTFDEAMQATKRYKWEGGGFVFAEGGGYAGVDFDDCRVDGELTPEAAAAVRALNSYTEISPSGNGVKVIAKGRHGRGPDVRLRRCLDVHG